MKSFKIITLTTFIFFVAIFFTACTKEEKVKSIEIVEDNVCIYSKNINLELYHLHVIKLDDSEETISINKNMISSKDYKKLSQEGTYDITISYGSCSAIWHVEVANEVRVSYIYLTPSSIVSKLEDFKYYSIIVEMYYSDGTTDLMPLSLDMVSNDEAGYLLSAGTHDITVTVDNASSILHVDLKPNEIDVNEIKRDAFIYCLTEKVDEHYESTFYYQGILPFVSFQFSLKLASNQINNLEWIENEEIGGSLIINQIESNIYISYTNIDNINSLVKLFTIKYDSNQQYRNFVLNNDENYSCYQVKDNEIIEIKDFFISLSR